MKAPAVVRRQIARGAAKAIERSRYTMERRSETLPAKRIRKSMPLLKPFAGTEGSVLEIVVPLRLVSLSNVSQREHWTTKHKRARAQHAAIDLHLDIGRKLFRSPPFWDDGIAITMTRIGPRRFDPGNNEASLKHVQDAIASWLGIDDGSRLLTWKYEQETERGYGVRIRIEPRET
jgi:hypothetical protein